MSLRAAEMSVVDGGLYARVLGAAAACVDPRVRALHLGTGDVVATGRFRRGRRRTRDEVPVLLWISRDGHRETWRRYLGDTPLVTHHEPGPDGTVRERLGVLELTFRPEVVDGGIRFDHEATALLVGGRRLRLPLALGPRVQARVRPKERGVRVAVAVSFPVIGPVLTYHGELEVVCCG